MCRREPRRCRRHQQQLRPPICCAHLLLLGAVALVVRGLFLAQAVLAVEVGQRGKHLENGRARRRVRGVERAALQVEAGQGGERGEGADVADFVAAEVEVDQVGAGGERLQATDEVVVGEGELGERGKGREAGEGVAADAAIAEAELLQGGEGRERLRGNQGRLISRGKGRSRARSGRVTRAAHLEVVGLLDSDFTVQIELGEVGRRQGGERFTECLQWHTLPRGTAMLDEMRTRILCLTCCRVGFSWIRCSPGSVLHRGAPLQRSPVPHFFLFFDCQHQTCSLLFFSDF